MDYTDEFGKLVGIHVFEVVAFMDVVLEIIEERLALTDHEFPIALMNDKDFMDQLAKAKKEFEKLKKGK